jgi:hypothetical protein
MSKAKELAREIKDYIDDANMGPRSKCLVSELIKEVLSEPEPELKGWIEVNVSSRSDKILLRVSDIMRVSDQCLKLVDYDDLMQVKESYEELKQLIKEAS